MGRGIHTTKIQCDAKELVKWICEDDVPARPIQSVIHECRRWVSRDWDVSIRNIFREQNKTADCMENLASKQENNWRIF